MSIVQKIARERKTRSPLYPLNPDSIAWIQTHFYIPERKDNTPPAIRLSPYQIATLRESFRKDKDGKFIYNVVIWSDIKKSAKSSISGAVALYRALHTEWASIKIVANDLKQADTRTAFYVRRALELNPLFRKGENYKQAGYKLTFLNNSTIEAIPIDPSGEAGGNDDLIIFSELWAAKHKSMQQMWAEMTLSPTKFGYSQRWIETYAGYEGESPILEQLYERGVNEGEKLDLSYDNHDLTDLEVYAAGDLLCLWNNRPRLAWQTSEYYESERAVQIPSEFNRIHKNEWGSSVEKFVEIIWWDQCMGSVPPFSRDIPVIIALDAAEGSQNKSTLADSFSMVMTGKIGDIIYVGYCGIWAPNPGEFIDYEPIEEELIKLCSSLSVLEVVYDPYQLHDMATRLRKQGIAHFKRLSQGSDRLLSDKHLRDIITQKRIVHDGNPLLREHINNANAKNHGESGIRLIKRSSKHKIDAAVALSMAAYRINYYNI